MKNLPPALQILILSMLPIWELRGTIPLGIYFYKFNPVYVYLLAVVGNIIPVIPLFFILRYFEKLILKTPILGKIYNLWLIRAKKKENFIKRYGTWGLTLFVAIPLPVTGAWTGTLLAKILQLNWFESFFYIALGVIVAGGIVSIFSLMGWVGALIFGVIILIIFSWSQSKKGGK